MYLSIGNDMAVRDRSIIGIFDLDNTSTSKRTRFFLEEAERNGDYGRVAELRYGKMAEVQGQMEALLYEQAQNPHPNPSLQQDLI